MYIPFYNRFIAGSTLKHAIKRANKLFLTHKYKPIYDFIIHNNLFKNIPTKNNNIQINKSSRLWLVDGHPCVRF